MGDDRIRRERQEFRDDFRFAVYRLMQIIENELSEGCKRITPDVREWRLQRGKTIEKLNELIDKLDKTCVAASYGKGVGIGTEIVGNITSILAALMDLRESSSAQSLMNIGNLLSHSGSFLEGASNAVESFVSAKYLSEIDEVLKRDQELSKQLEDWLIFSRNMDANIREIFGCDLNFAIQNNVLKVFSEFTMLYCRGRDFNQTVDFMKRGDYSMDIGTNISIERLSRFNSQLEMYPELHGNIRTICSAFSNSAIAIQVAREGLRAYRNMFRGEDLISRSVEDSRSHPAKVDSSTPEVSNSLENERVVEGSPSFLTERDCNRELSTIRSVSTFCAFQTVNVAVKVIQFSTMITAVKDGKSMYSQALRQISNLLSLELRSMEALQSGP